VEHVLRWRILAFPNLEKSLRSKHCTKHAVLGDNAALQIHLVRIAQRRIAR
jgi:hypothetical protein